MITRDRFETMAAELKRYGLRVEKTENNRLNLGKSPSYLLCEIFDGIDRVTREAEPKSDALKTALDLLGNWDNCRSEMSGPNTIEGRTRAFLKEQGYVQR